MGSKAPYSALFATEPIRKRMDEPDSKGSVATCRVCCVVMLACAVDAADKAMLPGTFKAMSEQMELGPAALGQLSFAQPLGAT